MDNLREAIAMDEIRLQRYTRIREYLGADAENDKRISDTQSRLNAYLVHLMLAE